MDPNETLRHIRVTCARILADGGTAAAADDLAETVDALDQWLARGGFLPAAWDGPTAAVGARAARNGR